MMTFRAILLVAAAAAMGARAQGLAELDGCGQFCVNDLMSKADTLGCAANDGNCLCQKNDFAYGIRDCAIENCGDTAKSGTVIAYLDKYCKDNGVEIVAQDGSRPDGSGSDGQATSAAGNNEATKTGNAGGAGGAGGAPVSTRTITTTVDKDGTPVTKTLLTTLYSGDDSKTQDNARPTQAQDGNDDDGSDGGDGGNDDGDGSDGGGDDGDDGSGDDGDSDGDDNDDDDGEDGRGTETTESGHAMKTAAPVGILAAAGLAALLV